MRPDRESVTVCKSYAERYRAMIGEEIAGLLQDRTQELRIVFVMRPAEDVASEQDDVICPPASRAENAELSASS